MAIISGLNQEEKKEEEKATAPGFGAQASQVGAQAPGAVQKGTSSGRFTNVVNYIKANQPKTGEAGLAGKIAGRIGGQAEQAQAGVQSAAQEFGQQAQGARQQFDETGVKNILSNVGSGTTDADVQKMQSQLKAKYAGPQGLANQEKLQAGVQNVQQLAGQTGTEQGRFGLLSQMFNKPTYSGGQQKLDQLLLQGNKDQMARLAATKRLAGRAGKEFAQQSQQAQIVGQNYAKEAQDTANSTANLLNKEQAARELAFNEAYGGAKTARETLQGGAAGASQGQLSQELLNSFGLQEGSNLYGLDLNKFITKGGELTKNQFATPEQFAQFNALARLSGNTNTFLTGEKDEAQNAIGFDKAEFDKQRELNKGLLESNDTYKSYQFEAAKQREAQQLQQMQNQADQDVAPLREQIAAIENRTPTGDFGSRSFEDQAELDRLNQEIQDKYNNIQTSAKELAAKYGSGAAGATSADTIKALLGESGGALGGLQPTYDQLLKQYGGVLTKKV